jgi:3-dehydroquinate synthetase
VNLPPDRDAAGERAVRIPVAASGHRYDVIIGEVLPEVGRVLAAAGLLRTGSRIFIGHDEALPESGVTLAVRSLTDAGAKVSTLGIPATESSKTLEGAEPILVHLARSRHERGEPVIALGGGIVGDVVGFAAAIYRRGVPVVQIPTTLLAMVDASIGGKTAVNLAVDGALMKNLVGAFHQPSLVIADITLLASLPERQLRCGLAECIKHGMIGAEFGEANLLDWIDQNAASILGRDPAVLTELVARNVALKAAVVALDEREEASDGGRALLNLGHTFGHAIETVESAAPENAPEPGIHHGEAVALGLIAAAHAAQDAGLCDPSHRWSERISSVVRRCGLPARARGLPPPEDILDRMAHDKKVKGGVLRLVLPIGPGRAAFIPDPPRAAVVAAIRAISAAS